MPQGKIQIQCAEHTFRAPLPRTLHMYLQWISPIDTMRPTILRSCIAAALCSGISSTAIAGTFYLPTQLAPEAEARVERLFVLANMPTIKRPIAINDVIRALEKVGDKDPALSQGIRQYIARYSKTVGLTHMSAEAGKGSSSDHTLNNRRGQGTNSKFYGSLNGYWAVNDFMAINAGAIVREGSANDNDVSFEGSFISVGWDALQADIGYRTRWSGPFQDSDMLVTTNATAMPGITLSNSQPFTDFGIRYELSLSRMSKSDKIESQADPSQDLSGYPKLLVTHLSFEPLEGFAIGFNRLLQFGGADRDQDPKSVFDALYNAKAADNIGMEGRDFGNQQSSITTRYTFNEGFPFSVYMEYAGEDTSAASDIHFGNSALMYGLHLPVLPYHFDVTYEHAEWQNGWYVNSNFGDGMQNDGSMIGHWQTNMRKVLDDSGGNAQTLKIIWDNYAGSSLTATLRTVQSDNSIAGGGVNGQELSLQYARAWGPTIVGASAINGENVLGESYSYLSGFIRW